MTEPPDTLPPAHVAALTDSDGVLRLTAPDEVSPVRIGARWWYRPADAAAESTSYLPAPPSLARYLDDCAHRRHLPTTPPRPLWIPSNCSNTD